MAIYGQSWRGGGNMSFRNPMAKAAMNNNPMGNQQTMRPSELAVPPQPLGMANLAKPTQSAGGMALKGVVAGIQANPATQPSYGTGRSPYSSDLIAPTGVALGMNRAESARQGAMLSTPQYRSPVAQNGLGGMGQQPRPFSQNGIRVDMPRQPLINQGIAAGLGGQNQPGGAYRARGIQPGSLRQDPIMAFEMFDNPDDFRVATGGMAMIPPPAARSVKPEYVQNSLDNARIARAARMRGVTASGIDQWRAQSPYAQGILKQSPARLAALRERMQPAAAPVPAIAPQVQPIAPQTSAVVQQPPQDSGMNNWSSATPQVQPIAPNVQAGVPQVQPDAQIPVDPKRLKAPTPYSSRIYPGMPRGEIQFKPTPNAFSSALRAFSGYQGN